MYSRKRAPERAHGTATQRPFSRRLVTGFHAWNGAPSGVRSKVLWRPGWPTNRRLGFGCHRSPDLFGDPPSTASDRRSGPSGSLRLIVPHLTLRRCTPSANALSNALPLVALVPDQSAKARVARLATLCHESEPPTYVLAASHGERPKPVSSAVTLPRRSIGLFGNGLGSVETFSYRGHVRSGSDASRRRWG